MSKLPRLVAVLCALAAFSASAYRNGAYCTLPAGVDAAAAAPLAKSHRLFGFRVCQPRQSHGYPIPDPNCTPGAVNPTVTAAALESGQLETCALRDDRTTAAEKKQTYGWYGLTKPRRNSGRDQTCELDHLVPLELGGADTLDNIWPQCGPDGVDLRDRYFKMKDKVENYLACQVRKGRIGLAEAQRGIASDWTQYIDAAQGARRCY